MGTLQVTQLTPGDLSRDEMTSAEYGTPFKAMAAERPRFLGIERGRLAVPLPTL